MDQEESPDLIPKQKERKKTLVKLMPFDTFRTMKRQIS